MSDSSSIDLAALAYDCKDHCGDLHLDADVVVVGSGASGAVVAAELADAGQEVIVLEEGRHVPDLGKMRRSVVLRHVFRDGGLGVALGIGNTPAINLMVGKGVGGSSLLTGGVCFRTPEHILDTWVRDHGLVDATPKALEPCFEAVEKTIHVEEVPLQMRSKSTRIFARGAEKLGYSLKPLRRNTDGCRGCGRCNFGCPHGAKLSVDLSYLPRAVQRGARVYASCLVQRIETSGDRAVGVSGRVLNGPEGGPSGILNVRARRVILACGAMHTPVLLRKSGLARRSNLIGKNLTLHPGVRVFGRFKEVVEGWKGSLQSAYSDAFEHEGLTLVGLAVPPSVVPITMSGAGPEHRWRSSQAPHIAMFGGMVHDDPSGAVRTGIGREPLVTYRMTKRDRARLSRLMSVMAETFLAAGAVEVYLPILGHPPVDADTFRKLDLDAIPGRDIECGSQHPLGTCRMGASPKTSAVDPDGQLRGLRELFIVDGGILPTSLGVNPQVTVMAIATQLAWRLRERRLQPV